MQIQRSSIQTYCYISFIVLLITSCNQNTQILQERYILPEGYKGYCAIFFGNNYNSIEDTSHVREYHFDSTGIVFTNLLFNTDATPKLFLKENGRGFDTLRYLLLPNEQVDTMSIYTSRVHTIKRFGEYKEVVLYVFYIGPPSADPGKETFFFNKKLEAIANSKFFDKLR